MESEFPNFRPNLASLLSSCRESGCEVVHVRERFAPYPDTARWLPNYVLRDRAICIEGSGGEQPLPEAAALPHETVLYKTAMDAFSNDGLQQLLVDMGCRFVLVCGLVTSVCVLQTAASALNRGFLAGVVDDCCADHLAIHDLILERYAGWALERVPSAQLAERHGDWLSRVSKLASAQPMLPPSAAARSSAAEDSGQGSKL
jgi:nicotinamidase-related amidase